MLHLFITVLIIVAVFPSAILAKKDNKAAVAIKALASITVLENGRKKPIDTYARNKLLQFSGKRRVGGKSALEWMAGLLFNPAEVDHDKVFLINNPELAQTLGIPPQRHRRYSYTALSEAADALTRYYGHALKTATQYRSTFEKEIIRIFGNLTEYRSLAATMSFIEPNAIFHVTPSDSITGLPRLFTAPQKYPSFLDMLSQGPYLSTQMKRIQKLPADSTTPADKIVLALTRTMFEINKSATNTIPHIIPTISNGEEIWMSPWGYISKHRSKAIEHPVVKAMIAATNAYRSGNQMSFDGAIGKINAYVKSFDLNEPIPDPAAELFYNRLSAFFWAKILLGLSALFAFTALFSDRKFIPVAALTGSAVAWILCTIGLILRMIIMKHPPVTNLYETFIFVAWTTIIIGFILEYMRIKGIGLLTASLAGFVFLHVAGRYAAEGDTLGMLAAILNSGFWLTTHIITIALGYAGCMGAGFIGHIYIIQRIIAPNDKEKLAGITKAVYGVFAFGMLFTVIGTVTGGMWADQAWGRFWGWDPKENGALLIILWSMIIFHFRLTKRIRDIGLAIGAIGAAVWVMFTWLGVNLLGTGMHSYGFTSSGARLLLGYSGFEVLFVALFGVLLTLKRKKT
jgi:ABC-type transport system involved in cytochrome c biogenesis permease subunit